MTAFSVQYFYLATGMEGIPDRREMGVVEAETAEQACDIVAAREPTEELRQWTRGCLSARPVSSRRIFILASETDATFGHGDYGKQLVVSDSYSPAMPAFESMEAAGAFLAELRPHERVRVRIVPLELLP